jgi:acetyltransferase-like isoleucine patch superfamily enzyme
MRTLYMLLRQVVRDYGVRQKIQRIFPSVIVEQNIENVVVKGDLNDSSLGTDVVIQGGTVLHLGGVPWCQNQGSLEIGDGGVISPNCVIYGGGPGGVRIGKGFDCGPGVGIFDSRTDYPLSSREHAFLMTVIGNDFVVFANAGISPRVAIGNGAVVAAYSVVMTRDVPANSLVAGSPARVVEESVKE